ncbi:uncharacterized protein [Typha latifolia]|uniref:uncharacterized protein isoform X1 n=2 Tax=Typha latifolia TaxID=4733 RepID=UPI003C2D8A26
MDRRNPRPSLKRSRGAPISQTSSVPRLRCDPASGAKQRKKVKFADSVGTTDISSKQDAPLLQTERSQSPTLVDGAKTSEFKYFKKLSEEADHKLLSYKLPPQDVDLKTSKERDVASKSDIRRFLMPIQKATPTAVRSSVSPSRFSRECELNAVTCRSDRNRYLLPVLSATPIAQRSSFTLPEASKHSGTVFEHEGMFLEKRSKLLKLASKTLSIEMDEFPVRRSDLITELLQRLRIVKKSDNHEKLSNSFLNVARGIHHSLASSNFHGSSEELYDQEQTIFGSTGRKSLRKDSLSHGSKEAGELLIASPWEYADVEAFPHLHALESGLQHIKKSNWADLQSSEPHVLNESPSVVELTMECEYGNYRHHPKGHMLSLSSSPNIIPNQFSSHCRLAEQSVVPFTNSTSLGLCSLHNPAEQFTSQLIGWTEEALEETELAATYSEFPIEIDLSPLKSVVPFTNSTSLGLCSLCNPVEQFTSQLIRWNEKALEETELAATYSEIPIEIGQLPLKFCNASSFPDLRRDCEIFDVYIGRNILMSPSKRRNITVKDIDNQNLDNQFSTSLFGYELERNTLPFLGWDCPLFHSKFQYPGGDLGKELDCRSTGDGYSHPADERSILLVHNKPLCDISNFSFLDPKFSWTVYKGSP